jgi:hypothetical protein
MMATPLRMLPTPPNVVGRVGKRAWGTDDEDDDGAEDGAPPLRKWARRHPPTPAPLSAMPHPLAGRKHLLEADVDDDAEDDAPDLGSASSRSFLAAADGYTVAAAKENGGHASALSTQPRKQRRVGSAPPAALPVATAVTAAAAVQSPLAMALVPVSRPWPTAVDEDDVAPPDTLLVPSIPRPLPLGTAAVVLPRGMVGADVVLPSVGLAPRCVPVRAPAHPLVMHADRAGHSEPRDVSRMQLVLYSPPWVPPPVPLPEPPADDSSAMEL